MLEQSRGKLERLYHLRKIASSAANPDMIAAGSQLEITVNHTTFGRGDAESESGARMKELGTMRLGHNAAQREARLRVHLAPPRSTDREQWLAEVVHPDLFWMNVRSALSLRPLPQYRTLSLSV